MKNSLKIFIFLSIALLMCFHVRAQIDDGFTPSGLEEFDEVISSVCKKASESCNENKDCCGADENLSICSYQEGSVEKKICKKIILDENVSCNSHNDCLNGLCENGKCRLVEGEKCKSDSECVNELMCLKLEDSSYCLSLDKDNLKIKKKKDKSEDKRKYISVNADQSHGKNVTFGCGGIGQVCCSGGICNSTIAFCNSSNMCQFCGGTGDVCCPAPMTACGPNDMCNSSNICIDCGDLGEVCCEGSTCNDSTKVCDTMDNMCKTCGFVGNPCCSGGTCQSNLVCNSGTCQFCGYTGNPCCPGNTCTTGQCIGGVCGNCGNVGSPCCPGNTCTLGQCISGTCQYCGTNGNTCCPGSNPCPYPNSRCNLSTNKCEPCGYTGTACCSGAMPCDAGNSCNTSINKCEACGSVSQKCCPGNTCNSTYLSCQSNPAPNPPTCKQCGWPGNACCSGNTCIYPSSNCVAGICQATCKLPGQTCSGTDICCSGLGTTCTGGICCRSLGGNCTTSLQCCSGLACNSGMCSFPLPSPTPCSFPGGSCTTSLQCCGGSICSLGMCCKATGQTCTIGPQCCTGFCVGGTCQTSGPSPTPTPTPTATPTPSASPGCNIIVAGTTVICAPKPPGASCPPGQFSTGTCCCPFFSSCIDPTDPASIYSCKIGSAGALCWNPIAMAIGVCTPGMSILTPCTCMTTP